MSLAELCHVTSSREEIDVKCFKELIYYVTCRIRSSTWVSQDLSHNIKNNDGSVNILVNAVYTEIR